MGSAISISYPAFARTRKPANLLTLIEGDSSAGRYTSHKQQRTDVSCSSVTTRERFPDVGGLGAATNCGKTSIAWHVDRVIVCWRHRGSLATACPSLLPELPIRSERRSFGGVPTPSYRTRSGRYPVRPRNSQCTHTLRKSTAAPLLEGSPNQVRGDFHNRGSVRRQKKRAGRGGQKSSESFARSALSTTSCPPTENIDRSWPRAKRFGPELCDQRATIEILWSQQQAVQ